MIPQHGAGRVSDRRKRDKRSRRGVATYVVAIVVVILTLGAVALLSLSVTEREATKLRGDEIQIVQTTHSGVELIRAATALSSVQQEQIGGLANNPGYFCNIEMLPNRPGGGRQGSARFTVIAPLVGNERIEGIKFGLLNESTRLHLGTVLRWEQESPGQGARSLMRLPGMLPSAADSILDWIDDDKQPRASGAEIEYYQRIGMPYGPRNAVPPSLEELLLVRDVSRKLLFGTDENFTFKPEPRSQANALGLSDPELPWAYLLTTLSSEKEVDPYGEARLDLNEANLEFLHLQLSEALDTEIADFIISYRQFGPDPESLAAQNIQTQTPRRGFTVGNSGPGLIASQSGTTRRQRGRRIASSGSSKVDFTIPAKFRIESTLDLLDVVVKPVPTEPDASFGRSARISTTLPDELESPFGTDTEVKMDRFMELLDYVTCDTRIVIPGRININQAPKAVLRAIPGLDDREVDRIIALRGPGPEFRHTFWLLRHGILSKERLKSMWEDITCGGDVYRAQVVGFYENQGTSSRVEVVIDSTVLPPRQVFFKDLTLYGRGFSDDVLKGKGAANIQGSLGYLDIGSSVPEGNFNAYGPEPPPSLNTFEIDYGTEVTDDFETLFSDDPFGTNPPGK